MTRFTANRSCVPARPRFAKAAIEGLEPRVLFSVAGLSYGYYQGTWTMLPNFSTLTPVKSGLTHNVDLSIRNQDVNYAFKWTGNISIPTTGSYTFYCNSDDGSNLAIDGTVVVNDDGVHGLTQVSGTKSLSSGSHTITIEYFQQGGGQTMQSSYSGPGITKQFIPDSVLTTSAPANVDVSSFGAVGNGTNDDSTAIQNAINATPDGSTLLLDSGKTYKLNTGLLINRPINVEGNNATLDLNTSAYPQNETVFYSSPTDSNNYTWNQTFSAGALSLNVPIATTVLNPGDTIFLQLGTDPNDSTQPQFAEVCQVTGNTGSMVSVNVTLPYAITTQGSLSNSIQRLTDVVQNVKFQDVAFNFVTGTTPDANLWLTMARNVTVNHLTGTCTIMANIVDSQNVSVTNCNVTLDQLTSSSGRLVSGWQDDGLLIGTSAAGNTASDAYDSSIIFLESWARGTIITNLTVNQTYNGTTSADVFHFTGNSYSTVANNTVINNNSGVNLVSSGSQSANYSFGITTINGPVKSAPLTLMAKLITGGHTYDKSNVTTTGSNFTVGSNWSDFQQALCSGVVESMSFGITSLTGLNAIFVTNSNGGGTNLVGSLTAGVTSTFAQFFGTDYAFNNASYPAKTMHFYTGTVPAGVTFTWSVTYYN